ncbi:MAG TPA: CBS domain-containing protein [Kofleriaceae bacterium]|jgi:CBS domain-containing protein
MDQLATARVGDLPLRAHATVGPRTVMHDVVDAMTARGRGAVLVEDGGQLVGIFTERDLLNRVDHEDPLWSHVVIEDVMTPQPMVVHADDSLAEALRRLVAGHRRHLPVVDERGHVTGLLSIRDLLAFVARRYPDEVVNVPPAPAALS